MVRSTLLQLLFQLGSSGQIEADENLRDFVDK